MLAALHYPMHAKRPVHAQNFGRSWRGM